MKKIVLQVLFSCIIISIAFAQNVPSAETNHKIGLQIGYDQGVLQDQNFSILNYNLNGLNLALSYERSLPQKKYSIHGKLLFQTALLSTSASNSFESSSLGGGLELGLLRNIGKFGSSDKLSINIGLRYGSYLDYLDWNYQDAFSFTGVHGLAVLAQMQYSVNEKQSIYSRLAIPFLQILVRPPYNTIDEFVFENEDKVLKLAFTGELSSFSKYQAFDWTTGYRGKINDRMELDFSYNLKLQQVQKLKTMTEVKNQFNIGLNVNF